MISLGVLFTTESPDTLYHDDMFNETVFVSVRYIPRNIASFDFREFNGVPIKTMAGILEEFDEACSQAELTLGHQKNEFRKQEKGKV